ncbi:TetR/AcrR family transcriptional regulator [Kozakia baliensis]|uniref:TetR/AcrR family transcriptional regulator n=1 Tax=Kozakia baliensis TaxID=153496 RepID=UPI00049864FB|nr:TetR/AcrR family transcriptional regulator [Kozakia baliensis]
MSNPRTGGRSAVVRAKVLHAAGELILAKGPERVTIPEIAQRAGVAVTSLYRRWGDANTLLLEVAADRLSNRWPLPDEGSIERDLKIWAGRIAGSLHAQDEASFLRTLLLTWNVEPDVRAKALATRIAELEDMLRRGRDRRERSPSLDEIIDHLLAPLYVRSLLGRPLDEAFAHQLVERLLGQASP